MKLFKEKHIGYYLNDVFAKRKSDIENMKEDKFLEFSSKDLVDNITNNTKLNHLAIDLESRKVETTMFPVPAEEHPLSWDVERGEKYPRARVSYIYEKPQESELLSYYPTGYMFSEDVDARIDKDKLALDHQTLYGENLSDEEKTNVKDWIENVQAEIIQTVEQINLDIDRFNNTVGEKITELVNKRHAEITARNQQNNDLNS